MHWTCAVHCLPMSTSPNMFAQCHFRLNDPPIRQRGVKPIEANPLVNVYEGSVESVTHRTCGIVSVAECSQSLS